MILFLYFFFYSHFAISLLIHLLTFFILRITTLHPHILTLSLYLSLSRLPSFYICVGKHEASSHMQSSKSKSLFTKLRIHFSIIPSGDLFTLFPTTMKRESFGSFAIFFFLLCSIAVCVGRLGYFLRLTFPKQEPCAYQNF